MKIYTGSGDEGMTSLLSGERLIKSHERIEAYGDVDELNSVLGVLKSTLPKKNSKLMKEIQQIQSDLFHVGAWLATSRGAPDLATLKKITKKRIKFLETAIDRMSNKLPTLKDFILPGGNGSAAWAQMARTVCRRAERHVVRLSVQASVGKPPTQLRGVIIYLNRLSDYFFVLARYCNKILEKPDVFWNK